MTPTVGEVAVDVDAVCVAERAGGEAVRIECADQPEIDTCLRSEPLELAHDRDTCRLVAVDAADHQHRTAAGRTELLHIDRPSVGRTADELPSRRRAVGDLRKYGRSQERGA